MTEQEERVAAVLRAELGRTPLMASPQTLRGRIFLIRRGLIEELLRPYDNAPREWRDNARGRLPELDVPYGELLVYPFSWPQMIGRLALALTAATALWQGLGMTALPLGGLLGLIFMAAVMTALLRLGEKILDWEVRLKQKIRFRTTAAGPGRRMRQPGQPIRAENEEHGRFSLFRKNRRGVEDNNTDSGSAAYAAGGGPARSPAGAKADGGQDSGSNAVGKKPARRQEAGREDGPGERSGFVPGRETGTESGLGTWQKKGLMAWVLWRLRRVFVVFFLLGGNVRLALWILFGFTAGVALIRDFLLGRAILENFLSGTRALLADGNVWPLFSSFYGFWIWLGLWLLINSLPRRLDMRSAENRLLRYCTLWYINAEQILRALPGADRSGNNIDTRRVEKIGLELYLFAAELGAAQRDWLLQRLRDLGVEFAPAAGKLRWSAALAQQYETLGIIREGDQCFVDTPPEFRDGVIVCKGLVRKIRQ